MARTEEATPAPALSGQAYRAGIRAAMQKAADAAGMPRPVPVPVWGTVFVRDVTVAEVNADTAEDDAGTADKKSSIARRACRVICDEAGTRLFDQKSADDVALLMAQPWSLLQKVLTAADSTGNA
jgi:hypothetical protein